MGSKKVKPLHYLDIVEQPIGQELEVHFLQIKENNIQITVLTSLVLQIIQVLHLYGDQTLWEN